MKVLKDKDGTKYYIRAKGAKLPWWGLMMIPVLPVYVWLRKNVKPNYKALGITLLYFSVSMFLFEKKAIIDGDWIYNRFYTIGELWGIPLIEIFVYYFIPPIFVIHLYELLKRG